MTFREIYAAMYGRRVVSIATIRAALRQIATLPPDLSAAWIEYRDSRLEARHAR